MKIMRFILPLFILILLACEKGRNFQFKCSGIWEVVSMEQNYYSQKEIDSTVQTQQLGTLMLLDNDNEYGNLDFDFNPNLNRFPMFLSLLQNGDNLFWGIDNQSKKRMTFVVPNDFGDEVFIYTILKSRRNKMEIQFTLSDSAGEYLAYREILYLERQK